MRRLSWLASMLLLGAISTITHAADSPLRPADAAPVPVYHFARPPQLSMVAGSQVYVVDDPRVTDDEFRYGVFWYVYRSHAWFQARHWNGPYVAIEPRDVPRAIITVPPGRWKHRPTSAPGVAARRAPPAWVAEKERRIHGGR